MSTHAEEEIIDVALIGAGVMSATLAALLKELEPEWTFTIFERLEGVALESSDAWNNAGTGHAALCELNYTPEKADGSIDITKAIQINESFAVSQQFWAYLVERARLPSPPFFINPIPHLSFVRGEANVSYLRKRHEALAAHPFFQSMEFSTDRQQLSEWMPLMMKKRDAAEKVAATRIAGGTDVDFGALTRGMIESLVQRGVTLQLGEEIVTLRKVSNGWKLKVKHLRSEEIRTVHAKFVFLGAGGGALPLLQKSGIREGKGFGGFPVSGQWLRCTNTALIEQHHGKVYGKASVGAPPMSVPHLDTRVIHRQKSLLFGPFAGFSTQFLKRGSPWDLPLSIQPNNLWPMVKAGLDNIPLTHYLVTQVLQKPEDRIAALREFLPTVKKEDWQLEIAGQRVQVIKKDPKHGGILQFGTEVICAGDGTIAALLGASPGASTSVPIMLQVIGSCFKEQMPAWQEKLQQMIPSYGRSLATEPELNDWVRAHVANILALQ